MDNAGPLYCFSMDDGVGYYKICKAWPKNKLFDRIDQVIAENPTLKHAGKVFKSKLYSHSAREKLGSGKSVRILKLRRQAWSNDLDRMMQLAEATGVLGFEVLGNSNCFTSWHEFRVYEKPGQTDFLPPF